MDTFPRKGIELSNDGEVMYPSSTTEIFALIVEFENGSKERRKLDDVERVTFNVHCKLHQNDMNVVLQFLRDHDYCVIPFFLVHPYLGTGIANFGDTKLPQTLFVPGNPGWFEFDLPFEATF